MQMARGVLPGSGGTGKRKAGRSPKPALLGIVGAGAAGVAVAARRRRRGAKSTPADTMPQPEPQTAPPSPPADEGQSSEDAP
jgi:hypothetical protein